MQNTDVSQSFVTLHIEQLVSKRSMFGFFHWCLVWVSSHGLCEKGTCMAAVEHAKKQFTCLKKDTYT